MKSNASEKILEFYELWDSGSKYSDEQNANRAKVLIKEFETAGLTETDLERAIAIIKQNPGDRAPAPATLIRIANENKHTSHSFSKDLEWMRRHIKYCYEREIMFRTGMIENMSQYEDRCTHLLPDEEIMLNDFYMAKDISFRGKSYPLLSETEIKRLINEGKVTVGVPIEARFRWALDIEFLHFPEKRGKPAVRKPVPHIEDYIKTKK